MLVGGPITKSSTTVPQGADVWEVVDHMLANWVSGLPVVKGVRDLAGVIAKGDFVDRRELRTDCKRSWLVISTGPGHAFAEGVDANARPADETVSAKALDVSATARLAEPIRLLGRHHKRSRVVGDARFLELSRYDLSSRSRRILETAEWQRRLTWFSLAKSKVGAPTGSLVAMREVVAELPDTSFEERGRPDATIATEDVQAVQAIVDQPTWVGPCRRRYRFSRGRTQSRTERAP